ncbi:TPA: hypothetical protein ACKP0L_003813 [Pseudomonas putida]
MLQLAQAVVGRKVEQRFGLLGLGRLIKLVELVTGRAEAGGKRITAVVAWGDLLGALQCDQPAAQEFLAYCDHARVLDQGGDAGRLRLTLAGELAALLASPAGIKPRPVRTLLDTDEQWAEWFAADLNCPPYLRDDPETRRIFRHWCASNVTVDEVEAAAIRATNAREAPHPLALHQHLKAMRQEKIRAAS